MSKPGPKIRTPLNSPVGFKAVPFSAEAPDYLSDRAKSEYARLVGVLQLRGILGATDPRLIELYAMNYDLARSAYDQIQADGCTVESDRGNLAEHPAVKTMNAATIRLKAIAVEMGLTPASAKASRAQPAAGGLDYWRAKLGGGA